MAVMGELAVVTRRFEDDGETPNNPTLPVVLLRGTPASTAPDPASWFETTFARNGWGGSWRWGVYPFHHYHTNNHEVLGVARGSARLLLGGVSGECFEVEVGDVIAIPAGVGHKCEESSSDFLVVGAYPDSRGPDLVRSGEGVPDDQRAMIRQVPLPATDPVFGPDGPVCKVWASCTGA